MNQTVAFEPRYSFTWSIVTSLIKNCHCFQLQVKFTHTGSSTELQNFKNLNNEIFQILRQVFSMWLLCTLHECTNHFKPCGLLRLILTQKYYARKKTLSTENKRQKLKRAWMKMFQCYTSLVFTESNFVLKMTFCQCMKILSSTLSFITWQHKSLREYVWSFHVSTLQQMSQNWRWIQPDDSIENVIWASASL